MAFAFEKLIVYQRSVAIADQVFTATEAPALGCGFLADRALTDAPRHN